MTVTAGNASRVYGADNPAFTYNVTGFVNGDTLSVVSGTAALTTTATNSSAPGSYPINFSTESLTAANYNFQVCEWNAERGTGSAVHHLQPDLQPGSRHQLHGQRHGHLWSGGQLCFSDEQYLHRVGTTVSLINAGTCTIQASQSGNANYVAATPLSQSFTVSSAASFTITPIPAKETVYRGVLAAFALQLNSVGGFKGDVKLTCSGGPVGAQCADLPQTVKLNGVAYAVSGILFPPKTAPGTYTVTYTGTSGSLIVTTTATFTVK